MRISSDNYSSSDFGRKSAREASRTPPCFLVSLWSLAHVLEKEARDIRSGAALAAECAAQTDGDGGEDIAAEDVADAKRSVKFQKVPHPNDGVVPEALVYGGPVLDRALALVFTFVLRTGLVPGDWLSGAMRCVYKRLARIPKAGTGRSTARSTARVLRTA